MQRSNFWAMIAPWILSMAAWSWELQELPMEEAGQGRVSQKGPIPTPQPGSRACQRAVPYTVQGVGLEKMWCKTHKTCIVFQGSFGLEIFATCTTVYVFV